MGNMLKDRVAVVTGAGRGLGRAEALALAAQGAKVVVNDLGGGLDGTGASQSPADEVVAEIRKMGSQAVASYESVATPEGAERVVKAAVDSFGRIDVLVNNAGILRDRMVFNMSPEEWNAVIGVHLNGTFYCTRFASAIMRPQRYGRIINTSSHSGLGNMGQANYSAAKEGIVGFTRTAARDLGRYGVTVNAIRPRAGTRMTINESLKAAWVRMWGQEQAEAHARELEELLRPQEIAALITYLASEAADHINGCIFEVWRGHVGIYQEPPPVAGVLWKEGSWTPEELAKAMPSTLTAGRVRELPASGFSAHT
ncbi:MAG: SDR family NAD(P)-dependent oxidoreductase [Chloroflexota bacterium]